MVLTCLKMGTIVVIVIAGVFFGRQHAVNVAPVLSAWNWSTLGAVLTALVPAMWAYNGFNDLGDLGEEILHPQKNIPLAIILGLLTVGGLYLMANVVYFHTLPFAQIASSPHVASDVVQSFAGSRGATWLTVAMAISALGALHVVVLTGARIPYAMARDGVFFQFAKRIQPSFHTPSGALIFLGCVAALLALTGTFEELYSLFVFAVWIFFALTAIAVLRLRRTEPESCPAISCLGLSLDAAYFLIGCGCLDGKPVDGPSRALVAGPDRDRGRHSIFLPLASGGVESRNDSKTLGAPAFSRRVWRERVGILTSPARPNKQI